VRPRAEGWHFPRRSRQRLRHPLQNPFPTCSKRGELLAQRRKGLGRLQGQADDQAESEFVGRDFDDPAVKLQAKEVAFGVVKDVSSGNSGVAFKVPNRESAVPPTHIGKYVLEHLLEMVASHLGHRQVKSAVIAVPAKFNSEQRAATALAFKLAGPKVTRVMEEVSERNNTSEPRGRLEIYTSHY